MMISEYTGSPTQIGIASGKIFCELIHKNIDMLVKRTDIEKLIRDDSGFMDWIDDQEKIILKNWPWLIEEIHGIAEGAGQKYRDILFLNLRVWQYVQRYDKIDVACSSMVVKLVDGSVANVGALDDPRDLYCGMIKVFPDNGYMYFTFPIAGTCWGNRGINSAGLCVGTSSQILPGLRRLPGSICADVANRVILQTCATVKDVREFCEKYPFTLNLACSDKNGNIFCVHQTTAGMFELSRSSPYALTNHVANDMVMSRLSGEGVFAFPESHTTRLRRGRLMEFYSMFNGKCMAEDVRKYVADRMQGDAGSICPQNNVVMTYANPQAELGTYWIAEPQSRNHEQWQRYVL